MSSQNLICFCCATRAAKPVQYKKLIGPAPWAEPRDAVEVENLYLGKFYQLGGGHLHQGQK